MYIFMKNDLANLFVQIRISDSKEWQFPELLVLLLWPGCSFFTGNNVTSLFESFSYFRSMVSEIVSKFVVSIYLELSNNIHDQINYQYKQFRFWRHWKSEAHHRSTVTEKMIFYFTYFDIWQFFWHRRVEVIRENVFYYLCSFILIYDRCDTFTYMKSNEIDPAYKVEVIYYYILDD